MPTDRDVPRCAGDAPIRFDPKPGAPSVPGAADAAEAAEAADVGDARPPNETAAPPADVGRHADAPAVPLAPHASLPPLDALRAAFVALIRGGALAADAPPATLARSPELRAAVAADVRALRASGLPPEAVVIAVKGRARDALRLALAGSPPAAADLAASLFAGDRRQRGEEWLARAITWCIDEYYSP